MLSPKGTLLLLWQRKTQSRTSHTCFYLFSHTHPRINCKAGLHSPNHTAQNKKLKKIFQHCIHQDIHFLKGILRTSCCFHQNVNTQASGKAHVLLKCNSKRALLCKSCINPRTIKCKSFSGRYCKSNNCKRITWYHQLGTFEKLLIINQFNNSNGINNYKLNLQIILSVMKPALGKSRLYHLFQMQCC